MTLKFVRAGDIIDKPPLAMWLMAVSFKLFGINELALSLGQALLALGIILLTYLMGSEVLGRKGGFLASIILMLSAQFFYITRTPLLDIPLTFFTTLAFYFIFKLDKTENPLYFYPLAASGALAVLTKGPVGVVIPAAAGLFYLLTTKKLKLLLSFHLFFSAVLFIFITAPWFIFEYILLGPRFAEIFFSRNLFRFLYPTDVIGNLKQAAPQYDFYSYFVQIFLLFAPWSGFIYPAVIYSLKRPVQRLFLIWAGVAVLIFAFSLNYKIGRYILPAFPALAIILADFIERSFNQAAELKKYILASAWLNTVIVLPLLILGTIFLFVKFPSEQSAFRPILLPFLSIFSLGMGLGTIYLFRQNSYRAIITLAASSLLAYLTLVTCGALFINQALPLKVFCGEINNLAGPNDKIIKFGGEEPRQEYFYLNRPLEYVLDLDRAQLQAYLKSKTKVYVLTQDKNVKAKRLREANNYFLFSN